MAVRLSKVAVFVVSLVAVAALDHALRDLWPHIFSDRWLGGYWTAMVTMWFYPGLFGVRRGG